jgi:hypothetical protein
MKKFRKFLIRQMDECKAEGLGSSVWAETHNLPNATAILLYVGKKQIAGLRIEPNIRKVVVPGLDFQEVSHPLTLSVDARDVIREIESYVE